jgi:hypothetical protein
MREHCFFFRLFVSAKSDGGESFLSPERIFCIYGYKILKLANCSNIVLKITVNNLQFV